MSIEVYLLVNLAADAALLAAAARALGRLDGRRVALCAGLCTSYAVLAALSPAWRRLPVQLTLLLLMPPLLLGRVPPTLYVKVAALLLGGALLSGGVGMLPPFAARGPLGGTCALTGASLFTLMLSARHPLRGDWQVNLALMGNGRVARFPALIDTGNRLKEPVSGQPVLIVEEKLLRPILPDTGWRELSFGAVGGGGRMACFKPAKVYIERGRRRDRGPDVWVAVSPAPLPGEARALAPSEFCAYVR